VTQHEFFTLVLRSLEACGIPYMVSGSVGAMLYGEPRLTNDLDVVVEISAAQADCLRRRFPGEAFYLPSGEFIHEVIRRHGQFNIIHVESGSKADLIVRKTGEFARAEFDRRRPLEFADDFLAQTAAPEDIILSKMLAYRSGGSDKHLADILSILDISGTALDEAYLQRWIAKLELEPVWQLIQTRRHKDNSPGSLEGSGI
jgi:hypothetical protein